MLKTVVDNKPYLFSFRYDKRPFLFAAGNTEVTTCFIREPGKDGNTVVEATVVRNLMDEHDKDVARKYALTAALKKSNFTRDQRRAFWNTYRGRS